VVRAIVGHLQIPASSSKLSEQAGGTKLAHDKAIVRKHLERIDGVTRTWIEWDFEHAGNRTKTLVVEVAFDTDPNSIHFSEARLDAIEETAKTVLAEETTMVISKLRIVPRT
jgi:hypothetical protein